MNDIGSDEAFELQVAAVLRREAVIGENTPLGFSAVDIASSRRRFATELLRRRALLVAVAAVSIAAIAVPLSLAGGRHGTSPKPVVSPGTVRVDTAATPPGWAPVPFGNGQLSVPASWYVTVSTGGSVCGLASEHVLVRQAPLSVFTHPSNCLIGQDDVVVAPVSKVGPPRYGTMLVNGIRVDLRAPVSDGESYVVPEFHMALLATGPLARRILGTLTYSPRAFVLGSSRLPVPRGWVSYAFGGVRLSAPSGWKLNRYSWWGGCPFGLDNDTVQLSTAVTFSAPGCPLGAQTAGSQAARYGIVVGAGPMADAVGVDPHECWNLRGMRACSAQFGGTSFGGENLDGVLTLTVTVPRQPKPVVVEIGLAGTGATALAILDSIRPIG
jgi:hypothetical protein